MFTAILKDILKGDATPGTIQEISKKLLKLEMLTLNFGDSLSLGPLFLELDRDIDKFKIPEGKENIEKIIRNKYKKRLRSLARRVASAQLALLDQKGESLDIEIPYDRVKITEGSENTYKWPLHHVENSVDELLDLTDEERDRYKSELLHSYESIRLAKTERVFTIVLSNANEKERSIQVDLEIMELGFNMEEAKLDTRMKFTLDFFNFPMIDNTRLTNNHRFALVLDKFDIESGIIKLHGVLFPGMYSSQRDKPFLREAIELLREESRKESG